MIKFKVWKSTSAPALDPQWYAHMIAGNNRIMWQSEGYKSEASAHKVCFRTWGAMMNAICEISTLDVPYTKDSLKPKVKGG